MSQVPGSSTVMGLVVIEHHDAAFIHLRFYVTKELFDTLPVSLFADNVLEFAPCIRDSADNCDRLSTVLVQCDIDQLIFRHPKSLHLFP